MIRFNNPFSAGKLIEVLFEVILSKKVISETELIGYLAKAGFVISPAKKEGQEENPLEVHTDTCICESCQKEKGLQ